MCGIAGIWKRGGSLKGDLVYSLDKMLESIAHRGPDDGGMAVGEQVALGNRRLSIFDLSEAGNQPFFSDDGQVWLVLNGEIYNHLELRQQLAGDFCFKSNTDTEVLLRAYEKWGMGCLEHLNGMFAFAIWDARLKTLFLCRDRIGIKPLYYHFDGEELHFGSEIKALLAAGLEGKADWAVWQDYLVDGYYDHTDKTFFRDFLQVKQGHYLAISQSGLRERCYWDLHERVEGHKGVSAHPEEEYWDLLEDAVSLRMRADVPSAVMLSGGLDSSVIATLAASHLPPESLQVGTFRHQDPRFDEGCWADLVAFGKGWHQNDVTLCETHVEEMFTQALWHQDEPFGSVASFADMLLASKARDRGILVLLEGQGADETLGGYEYYYSYYLADLHQSNPGKAKKLFEQYALLRGMKKQHLDAAYKELLAKGASVQGGVGQDGTKNTMSQLLMNDFSQGKGTGWALKHNFDSRFETVLYRDLTMTKVPRVLRFKDKASMMYGVELRVPFLDHRLLELSFQIPASRKMVAGYTKNCLRTGIGKRLPREICYHVKRQIQTPQGEWLRGALRPMVEEVIFSKSFRERGIFDVAQVHKIYRDCVEHPSRYPNTFFVWQWLQLEWWFRIFVDQSLIVSSSRKGVKNNNTLRCPSA